LVQIEKQSSPTRPAFHPNEEDPGYDSATSQSGKDEKGLYSIAAIARSVSDFCSNYVSFTSDSNQEKGILEFEKVHYTKSITEMYKLFPNVGVNITPLLLELICCFMFADPKD
jgi:hypothetical protein